MKHAAPAFLAVWFGLLSAAIVSAGDWPTFRGPNGDGTAEEDNLPLEWGPDKNVKWKVPLPAPGNSSPVVSGHRVFVTVAENNGKKRSLLCFDRESGEKLWEKSVAYEGAEETHKTNPHAAATPVTDGRRVVVWFGSAGMHCYRVDGTHLWSTDLGKFHHIWGYGSSPILHDGHVIQLCGPGVRQMLVSLRLEDGEVVWKTAEPGGSDSAKGRYIGSWATPLVIDTDGQNQLLVPLPTRVAAFDPADGKVLWYLTGLASDRSDLCYTSPLATDTVGMIMGGFGGPEMAFRLGGSGDVTEENLLWRNVKLDGRRPALPAHLRAPLLCRVSHNGKRANTGG